jgi:hypothetical protein
MVKLFFKKASCPDDFSKFFKNTMMSQKDPFLNFLKLPGKMIFQLEIVQLQTIHRKIGKVISMESNEFSLYSL